MTYTDARHRHALTLLDTAQLARVDAGLDALEDDRALESMALESVGDRSERFGSVAMRARLAQTAHDSALRRAAMTAGDVLDPVALLRAMGRTPNRAARRAAARQARATRKRKD